MAPTIIPPIYKNVINVQSSYGTNIFCIQNWKHFIITMKLRSHCREWEIRTKFLMSFPSSLQWGPTEPIQFQETSLISLICKHLTCLWLKKKIPQEPKKQWLTPSWHIKGNIYSKLKLFYNKAKGFQSLSHV